MRIVGILAVFALTFFLASSLRAEEGIVVEIKGDGKVINADATGGIVVIQEQAEDGKAANPGTPMRVQVMSGAPGMIGRWGIQGRQAYDEILLLLGNLNLGTQFTLTAEQKERLTAIRDGVQQAEEKWRKDHEEDFKKLDEESRQATGADRATAGQVWREISAKRAALMQTAPKADDSVAQIKLLLTEDQRKTVEAKLAEKKAAAEEQLQQLRQATVQLNRLRNQVGNGPGGVLNPNPNPNPNPKPEEKK